MKRLYFIAIEIPEPLKATIEAFKRNLSEKYHAQHALKTLPHITLQMPMRIDESREVDLLRVMDKLNASIEKGSIKLNRIASFPARTIFIDVLNQGLVSRAYKAVQGALAGLDFIEDRIPVESFHPHITLMTRDLSKKFYYPAFEALKDMEFEEEIDISSITLFRHDGKKWQGIKQIPLKN